MLEFICVSKYIFPGIYLKELGELCPSERGVAALRPEEPMINLLGLDFIRN